MLRNHPITLVNRTTIKITTEQLLELIKKSFSRSLKKRKMLLLSFICFHFNFETRLCDIKPKLVEKVSNYKDIFFQNKNS